MVDLSERLVSRIWSSPYLLPARVRGTAGEPIELIYRGRWSHGNGPDFRDALLTVGRGPLLRGEVEIHLRSSDWNTHGHQRDSRYDSVALHVVMWDDLGQPVRKSNGEPLPTLVLAELLCQSSEELARMAAEVSSDTWPADDHEAPCSTRSLPIDALASLLEWAGEERLRAKAARLEADLAAGDPEQVLYERLAEALGYRGNQQAFRRLADLMPLSLIYSLSQSEAIEDRFTTVQSLLFGAAGLLPSQRPSAPELDWESSAYAEELERRWLLLKSQWGDRPMAHQEWSFVGGRPPNYPTRRIAALAQLLSARQSEGLLRGLTSALRQPSISNRLLSLRRLLDSELTDPFWARRCDFGRRFLAGKPKLIGDERAADMVVNVLLPFALAWADWAGQPEIADAAGDVYRQHPPLADNEITRQMLARLRGRGEPAVRIQTDASGLSSKALGRSPLLSSARRQQGLLHLYWQYCHDRSCLDCPALRLVR